MVKLFNKFTKGDTEDWNVWWEKDNVVNKRPGFLPPDAKPSKPKPSEPKPSEPKPSEPKPSVPKPSDFKTALIPPVTKLKKEGEYNSNIGEVLKSFVNNSSPEFFPYMGNSQSGMFYYMWVLEQSKNDCSMDLELHKKIYGRFKVSINDKRSPYSPNIIKHFANEVAKSIVRCKKRNKVLAIPITKSGHANMCIFNYHRLECERYEPHGFKEGSKFHKSDWGMPAMVKEVNKELKILYDKGKGDPDANMVFKLVHQAEVCPTKKSFEGYWKNHQMYGRSLNEKRTYEGVLITEAGGYCLAYSFMYLRMRLADLKSSPQETIDKSFEVLKKDQLYMVSMIRGQTKLFFIEVKKMVDEGLITLDDVVSFYGSAKWSGDRYTRIKVATAKYLGDRWAKYTT